MQALNFTRLLILSSALSLPGMALAQFPYSAWNCETRGDDHWCSPALIPSEGQQINWGEIPAAPDLTAVEEPVTDEELTRFASAFSKIKGISQSFTQSLPEDANADDTKSLRDEAHGKALQAMQSANISLSDYNQIAEYLSRNYDLRMQVIPSVN